MNRSDIKRPSPIPENEAERLAALLSLDVLDSSQEPAYDRIAAMAARIFQAPIALVSLVDSRRQWFKAKCGLAACETSRDFSFCTFAMLEPGPMVVCDATRDPRFVDNPLVTGEMSIRFYVGAPILSPSGLPLGTLCVIDRKVRERPDQYLLDSLMDLAFLVSEQLKFRSAVASRTLAEKRHQEQLELARQAADEADQAKSEFLARMSHEIRTPMNLVLGMSTLLLESPLNEKQKKHVEISNRNVRRLLRLVNGILDLSKVEAGEIAFRSDPFELDDLLRESAATISSAVERKGLKLDVVIEPNTPLYWIGDAEHIQQVILNLVGNAIKFTDRGRISVRVCAPVDSEGERGLRFEVNDTGCGVPKGKEKVIFGAFQQAEDLMKRSHEGTGLGLSIAKSIVERMSGKIWVEEKKEPGAKFVFTIFLASSSENAVNKASFLAKKHSELQPTEGGLQILLVEDNPENVILMEAYLEGQPVALDIAFNGADAVEKRRMRDYNLILMDIQMPVMDGYTATRLIRLWEEKNGKARVPILALTAHAFNEAAAESLKAGCNAHLTKPIERGDLLDAITAFTHLPNGEFEPAGQPAIANCLAAQ